MRPGRLIVIAAIVAALAAAAASAGTGGQSLALTPVARTPFPERGYIVDLPADAAVNPGSVRVTENGRAVGDFAFTPLNSSGLRSGFVLAIDESNSMTGAPSAAALAAARSFVARSAANAEIGLVTFNGKVHVLQRPTTSRAALMRALAKPPALAYGTHIYDAVDRSVRLLQGRKLASAAIVLLSDGADVGSRLAPEQAVKRAVGQHVRVFTVGLRSGTFDSSTLQTLARETQASYAEATRTAELSTIYRELSKRLASEYVLQYSSAVAPETRVAVSVTVPGMGAGQIAYTAPTPSRLPPFHRSLLSRFLLSQASVLLLALLVLGLVGYGLSTILETGRSRLVERIGAFSAAPESPSTKRPLTSRARHVTAAGSRHASRWMQNLERDLDIAGSQYSAATVALATIGGTAFVMVVLALVAPATAVLGLLTPFAVRSWVRRSVRRVRDEFGEQLPPNLQVLASALRTGHSFAGALAVAVENAVEPSRRELRRAVADDRLGIPTDEAIRRVAERMASRDLEQVALVAELQRTTGGNVAEVLDTVVGTIRDRADVRRMAKTLTAQGRMARWILSSLPVVTGLGLYAIQPNVMKPMLSSTVGQLALVIAAAMAIAGSLVIQRIVEIEV